jgi:hypothetical protein
MLKTMIHRLTLNEGWHFVSLHHSPVVLAWWDGYKFTTRCAGHGSTTVFREILSKEINFVLSRMKGDVNNPRRDELEFLSIAGTVYNATTFTKQPDV